jgi:hypothetical protein
MTNVLDQNRHHFLHPKLERNNLTVVLSPFELESDDGLKRQHSDCKKYINDMPDKNGEQAHR